MGGQVVEGHTVLAHGHTHDDVVGLRDDLSWIVADLGQGAVERLQHLTVDRMQLELDLLGPLAGPAGQDVDLETGAREEGDQHVRAAPATDDSYYLLLRFCHF